MAFIHLFRCKAEPLPQMDAFAESASPSDVIVRSFMARPTAKVPRGAVWHDGNTSQIISPNSATDIARSIAMPGAAILVGLAFAWAGRSASLLQDKAFSKFIIEDGPPAEGYVYSFQLAILTVIAFVVIALSLIAGGVDISLGSQRADDIANKTLLIFAGSLALRECWGVILFVNKLTIQYYKVRELELAAGEG